MDEDKNSKEVREIGFIDSYFTGVAKIKGIENALFGEILTDEQGNGVAFVIGFDEGFVDAIFFNDDFDTSAALYSSGNIFRVPVSENYLGRVVNGIGEPLDGKPKVEGEMKDIFLEAPPMMDRIPIQRPLVTGIKIIDTTLPLGRGQRELIIGDRKLGKTTIALDVVLNQSESSPKVYCVYVVTGRKDSEVERILDLMRKTGAMLYSVVVSAPSSTSLADQYLAPMVGTTIAEGFRDAGRDALVIYDDLTSHAKVARSISLLLKRAPGREVYPGDIFSLHASLLERSSQLSQDLGGGSLTALPIMETQEGDLASYIATNLISITDGQIYLDRGLYDKGSLPAIDIGLSVSRIGSQAQPKLLKDATKDLRLSLAQNRELEKLTQLENNLSAQSQSRIKRGKLILTLLRQDKHTLASWQEQVLLFTAVSLGKFDKLSDEDILSLEKNFLNFLMAKRKLVVAKIDTEQNLAKLTDDIGEAADAFLKNENLFNL
jgi:F-type H+-transporting ATPase subunit alpha